MSDNEFNFDKLMAFFKTPLGIGVIVVVDYAIYSLSNSYSTYDECVVHKVNKITNTEVARTSVHNIRRICKKEFPFPPSKVFVPSPVN